MERLPDTYIPGLGQWPMALPEKVRLAGKATEDQVQGLLDQPMGTPLEEVGRALRAAVALGVENPLRVGKAAFESGSGLIGRGVEEVKRGFGVTPAPVKTAAPVVSPDKVPSTANPGSAAPKPPPTTTTVVKLPPRIQAFKDAQGRITYTNAPEDYGGQEKLDYAATTAAMRATPDRAFGQVDLASGRQAGAVSSPTALDESGLVQDMERPTLENARAKEVAALSHKATVQQLTDKANPQAKVQRDIEAANSIANLFTPDPADVETELATVIRGVAAQKNVRPEELPADMVAFIRQDYMTRIRNNRQNAIQEYLNKERYPGSTLSGYGGQLRGEAADITSR